MLAWMDLEMTGLEPGRHVIVEIATLLTDDHLNVIAEGPDLVIHATPAELAEMGDFVTAMHTTSGLITEIPNGISVVEAELQVIAYLLECGLAPGKSPLAGNSVGVDRTFIARDMPALNEFLHYRTIDVSSIKELARRWYPKAYFASPAKTGNHRALGDIQDSIAELAYYRSAVFIAP